MADPDWTDPCAVLAWLRPQYYKVAAGRQTVTTVHGDTQTTYSRSNLRELVAVMRDLEAQCAKAQGSTTGRRRAFIAG